MGLGHADNVKAYAIMPQTFEDVIELLLPELRKRGLFWDGYCVPDGTYRENLLESPGQAEPPSNHPAGKLIWRPQSKDSSVANGVNGINGSLNGHQEQRKDGVDPVSMQLS